METSISNKKAKIYLAIATTLWGLSNIYAKFALEDMSVGFYAGVKYAIAAVVFLLVYPPTKKAIFGTHSKELLLKVTLTLVSLTLFYLGITKVTGFTSTMILALAPIALFVMSIEVMHEKLKFRVLTGLAVALSGVLLMILATGSNEEGSTTTAGVLLLLAMVGVETVSALVSKNMLKHKVTPEILSGVTLTANALYFSAIAIWQATAGSAPQLTIRSWVLVVIAGLIFTLIPWTLYFQSLKNIDLEEVSVFGYLGPVAGAIGAVLLLGEQVTIPILVGSGLVLLGIWLSQHKARYFKPHFHAPHHIELGKNLRAISAKIIDS